MPGQPHWIPALCLCFAASLYAADTNPDLKKSLEKMTNVQGQSFTYEEDGKVLVAIDASFEANEARLVAKKIRFDSVSGIITAEGNIIYTTKNLRIMGERVMMDPKADLIVAENVKFGRNPYYFTAEELRIEKGDKSMRGVRMWNKEPHPYGMELGVESAYYSEKEDWLSLHGTKPYLAGIPFLYVPYYGQEGYKDIPYDVELETGSNDSQGKYLRTMVMVRTSPKLWVGGLLDYYTDSGLLIGPSIKFDSRKNAGNETIWHGFIKGGYIHDNGTIESDKYSRIPDQNRGFLNGEIAGRTNTGIEIAGQVFAVSDANFIRNFRPRLMDDLGYPHATFEITSPLSNGFLSGNVVAKADNYQDVVQKLPEVRYDLPETPLGLTSLNQRSFVSVSYLTQRPSEIVPLGDFASVTGSNSAWSSSRLDAYYGLTYPIRAGDYLSFKPVIGARATHWTSGLNGEGATTKVMGQAGFDLEGLATGSWNLKAEKWSINGMRHSIRPFIQYRVMPGAEEAAGEVGKSDRSVALAAFHELDLADRPDVMATTATQVARMGIRNSIETRDTEWGTRELLRFDVMKDWSNRDGQALSRESDLLANIRLSPAPWVTLESYNRYGKQGDNAVETLQSIAFNSGDFWKASAGWYELNYGDPARQLWLRGEVRLNSVFSAILTTNYDALVNAYTYQSIGLIQRIGNSWEIEYGFQKRVSALSDGSLGFRFRVRLFKF